MKFMSGPNPLFLGDSGIGQNFGQMAPQILFFDVYYTCAPVVGFHVVEEPEDE